MARGVPRQSGNGHTEISKGYLHIRCTGLMSKGASSETGSRTCESLCERRADLGVSEVRVSMGQKGSTHREGGVLGDGEVLRVGQVGAVRLVAGKVVLLHRISQTRIVSDG